MSILQKIASGSENSSSVLIQDTVEHSGQHILKCVIKELAKRVDEIHLFAFDHTPDALLAGADAGTRLKIRCHDGWTDPHGWNQDRPIESKHNLIRFHSRCDLVDHIGCQKQQGSQNLAVVIDSLTPLILHRSLPVTCRTLHSLIHRPDTSEFQISQVISLLHSDVHDSSVMRTLEHMSSTVIGVSSNASIAPLDKAPIGFCDILHKRPSGKVIRKREGYSIGGDYSLITFQDIPQVTADNVEAEQQPDPTANLTFNLTLKESERKAKESVVLPYTQVTESAVNVGSGQIYYEPDQADDYDDEDPDDDLDI